MGFKQFCYDMWLAHKDEVFEWEKRLPDYNCQEYFARYKWMLKKMFKEQESK